MQTTEGYKSIPRTVLEANGIGSDQKAVFFPNFVAPDTFLPTPDGDAYLTGAGLVASEPGGTTVILKTPQGYVDHMREVGALPGDTKVIEVPARITDHKKPGYPATDPLAQLIIRGDKFNYGESQPFYVGVWENSAIKQQAETVGLQTMGRPDSNETNNKAKLRSYAPEYGINLLPGANITDWDQLFDFVTHHDGQKVWLKMSTGSGGDLVLPIDKITERTAVQAIEKLRGSIAQAFERADLGMTLDNFWPEGAVSPLQFPNVIEEDAGAFSKKGEPITNGSNCFVTKKEQDGSYGFDYIGTFEQITSPDGEFMGSRLKEYDPEIMRQIMDQTERIARYNMEVNGYFGLQGMDFFVLVDRFGQQKVYPIEVNSRQPISYHPANLMDNLATQDGYSHDGKWENVNRVARRAVTNTTKVADILGSDLAFGIKEARTGRVLQQVIPLATRSLAVQDAEGQETVHGSGKLKLFIYGSDGEQLEEVKGKLDARGIVYKE